MKAEKLSNYTFMKEPAQWRDQVHSTTAAISYNKWREQGTEQNWIEV